MEQAKKRLVLVGIKRRGEKRFNLTTAAQTQQGLNTQPNDARNRFSYRVAS